MRDNLLMVLRKASGYFTGQMDGFMKAIGRKGECMETENCPLNSWEKFMMVILRGTSFQDLLLYLNFWSSKKKIISYQIIYQA